LKKITLIAHRGYSSEAPENTLSAFNLAISHGYTDIELDVQLTKDGVPVIFHDETIDRTTNGNGRVDDHTHAQLFELDAGAWLNKSFANEKIPTLEETLINLKGRAALHLELKSKEKELPAKIANLLEKTGWLKKQPVIYRRLGIVRPMLVISSFDRAQLLRSIQLLSDSVLHELLVEKVSEESLLWASMHKVRSYHPNGRDVTPELVKRARQLHLHIGAWWDTRDDQNARDIARTGARYAYVDSPLLHDTPIKRSAKKLKHTTVGRIRKP